MISDYELSMSDFQWWWNFQFVNNESVVGNCQSTKFDSLLLIFYVSGRTFPVEQLFVDDIMDLTNYVLEENGTYARKVKKGKNKT